MTKLEKILKLKELWEAQKLLKEMTPFDFKNVDDKWQLGLEIKIEINKLIKDII